MYKNLHRFYDKISWYNHFNARVIAYIKTKYEMITLDISFLNELNFEIIIFYWTFNKRKYFVTVAITTINVIPKPISLIWQMFDLFLEPSTISVWESNHNIIFVGTMFWNRLWEFIPLWNRNKIKCLKKRIIFDRWTKS